jgi:predicted DNA-binding helix-hairpin-helix protein
MKLWKRGAIEGVFLSSSVVKDPNIATLAEVQTAELLRAQGYTGYLHLRLMPSCSRDLVQRAVRLADRVGLNVENPDPGAMAEIRVGIDPKVDVWRRMEWCREEAEKYRRSVGPGFARAGLDTQFVVGAADETDAQIIDMTYRLYSELGLRRVYYSGFWPIPRTPLENREPCPKYREYRLYQVSFLIRDYGFRPEDFEPALDDHGFLRDIDPKLALAHTRPELYPVDLNVASMKELLLVPGIGPRMARRILDTRKKKPFKSLSHAQRSIGVRLEATLPYVSVGRERQERLERFDRQ